MLVTGVECVWTNEGGGTRDGTADEQASGGDNDSNSELSHRVAAASRRSISSRTCQPSFIPLQLKNVPPPAMVSLM
jgi:hypothetical protein